MSEAPKNNVEKQENHKNVPWEIRKTNALSAVKEEFKLRLSKVENPTDEDKADVLWGMLAEYQKDIQANYYLAKELSDELLHPLVGNPVDKYKQTITPHEEVAV